MTLLQRIFLPDSKYNKRARLLAILWTLLILFACFIPSNEVPDVDVPFIDKWVHCLLFGGFSFLWMCAGPDSRIGYGALMALIAIAFGCDVELLQGVFASLGRTCDAKDALADALGAFLGVVVFYLFHYRALRRSKATQ